MEKWRRGEEEKRKRGEEIGFVSHIGGCAGAAGEARGGRLGSFRIIWGAGRAARRQRYGGIGFVSQKSGLAGHLVC